MVFSGHRDCGSEIWRVPKWLKMIIAVLLLPLCMGAGKALWQVLLTCSRADTFWLPVLCGAACWLSVFFFLPKPMLAYVFGHELTHALWTWLCGGKVKKLKASSKGGHVVVTKNNFLIALAPYFFPIYLLLTIAVYAAGSQIWDWRKAAALFYLLVGASYAFHITFTWHVMETDQTDISQQGYLFSAVVVFLGNVLVLLLGLPLLTGRPGILTALGWWMDATGQVLRWMGRVL
jgi:hypothetical protein